MTAANPTARAVHRASLAALAALTAALAGCGAEPLVERTQVPAPVGAQPLPHPRGAVAVGSLDVLSADDGEEPQSDDDAADLPPLPADLSTPGPYGVGVRTVEVMDVSRDRQFAVDVWYPIEPGTADGEANEYQVDLPLIGTVSRIASPARRDATPAALGPRPLVVFSHGYGGVRFQSVFLTEHLASWGVVVAAPDHPGNTLSDVALLGNEDAAAQSAQDRPLDVAVVLDRMVADGLGTGLTVDAARIATSGHSFGGWTSLEVARRDARVRAILPLAPGFKAGATPDFVATLGRPVLFVGGTLDDTCEFDTDQQLPYGLAQTPKHLLGVVGAGHLDFSNLCDVAIARAFVDDGCNPDNIEPAVVHQRVRAVGTAFVLRYLLDDLRAEERLAESVVSALGDVTYQRAP
ncbi:MAG: alpha/beta hydrolase [Deltaproteobacteria bacterium]|nr:alpha/beta hydrolase [Deltaproteobacteria bacterium]